MTVALYIFYTCCASSQSAVGKLHTKRHNEVETFNIWKALTCIVFFLIFGLFTGLQIHIPTVICGLIYGMFLSASMYFGIKALSEGSIALTNTITSFSLIVPLIYGIFILGEKFSFISAIGTVFLVASILMINLKRENNVSPKWVLYSLTTMLTNGMCSVMLKQHQRMYPGQFMKEFMLVGMLMVFVFISLIPFAKRKIQRKKVSFSPLGIISGVLTSIANFTLLYMSSTQKASVLFPVIAVANVVAVCLIGKLLFKEEIRPLQIFGIIFGIAAIFILSY